MMLLPMAVYDVINHILTGLEGMPRTFSPIPCIDAGFAVPEPSQTDAHLDPSRTASNEGDSTSSSSNLLHFPTVHEVRNYFLRFYFNLLCCR